MLVQRTSYIYSKLIIIIEKLVILKYYPPFKGEGYDEYYKLYKNLNNYPSNKKELAEIENTSAITNNRESILKTKKKSSFRYSTLKLPSFLRSDIHTMMYSQSCKLLTITDTKNAHHEKLHKINSNVYKRSSSENDININNSDNKHNTIYISNMLKNFIHNDNFNNLFSLQILKCYKADLENTITNETVEILNTIESEKKVKADNKERINTEEISLTNNCARDLIDKATHISNL